MRDRTSRGHRAMQRVTLGSGPLERGSDRVEVLSRLLEAAVLLLAAPGEPSTGTSSPSVRVPAVWRAPDGGRREGLVRARHGTPAGQPVSIWIDPDGTRTQPPLDTAGAVTAGVVTGVLTLLGLAVLASVGHLASATRRGHAGPGNRRRTGARSSRSGPAGGDRPGTGRLGTGGTEVPGAALPAPRGWSGRRPRHRARA